MSQHALGEALGVSRQTVNAIETVTSIAPQLISTGKVTSSGRASLGITAQTVADAAGQPAGVGIVGVTLGGAAAQAGMTAGDIVTALAGNPQPAVRAYEVETVTPGGQHRYTVAIDIDASNPA